MKRNNIFMWAYIVAIVLCAFRRVQQDFAAWDSIVVAITVSSIIFAVEDLAKSIYQTLDDNMQYLESYLNEIKTNLKEEGDILSRVAQQLARISHSEERRQRIESTEKSMKRTMELSYVTIHKHEKFMSKYQKVLEFFRWDIDILTFVGFLSIFLIVFFSDEIQVTVVNQELLSVVAFAVILVTQQINQFTTDNIKNHINNLEKLRIENTKSVEEAVELEKAVIKLANRRENANVEATANAN